MSARVAHFTRPQRVAIVVGMVVSVVLIGAAVARGGVASSAITGAVIVAACLAGYRLAVTRFPSR